MQKYKKFYIVNDILKKDDFFVCFTWIIKKILFLRANIDIAYANYLK